MVEHLADDGRRGLAGPDDRDAQPRVGGDHRAVEREESRLKTHPPRKYVTTSAPRTMTERGMDFAVAKLTLKSTTPETEGGRDHCRASAMLAHRHIWPETGEPVCRLCARRSQQRKKRNASWTPLGPDR